MPSWAIFVLIVLNIPLYRWFFRFFFNDSQEFKKALMYMFRINLISLIRGEYWDDIAASMKATMYFVMCGIVVLIEFTIIDKLMNWVGS